MKNYYTVKEAARMLGVSTNTIYTYLKEGQLKGKRIGRGRFKIPQKELAAFSDTPENLEVEKQNSSSETPVLQMPQIAQVPSQDVKTSETLHQPIQETVREVEEPKEQKVTPDEDVVSSGNKDVIFYRIFKAVTFLGLGIIYLLTGDKVFSFSGTFLENSGGFFTGLLPFSLLFIGLLNFLEVLKPKVLGRTHLFLDIITTVVLGYYSFIAFTSGEYGRLVYALAFTLVAGGHLIQGVRDGLSSSTFSNSYIRYMLYLTLIGGVVIVVYPIFVQFPSLANYISTHKEFSLMLWYSLLCIPLMYFLTYYGKNSLLIPPFFILGSFAAFAISIEANLNARWDLSYLSFMTGVISLFFGWWAAKSMKLSVRKLSIVVLSFSWIGATVVFGSLALRASREQIKQDAKRSIEDALEVTVSRLNDSFAERSSVVVFYSGSSEVKDIVKSGDSEAAINKAKEIYDKLDNTERVIIYQENGIAQGVYPRNSLAQGTNFSSQEYFQKTLATYKGFVSPVFESILGTNSVIQTEPIFDDNQFIGMIGVSLDLSQLTSIYNSETNTSYTLRAYDENDIQVFAGGSGDPGNTEETTIISIPGKSSEEVIEVTQLVSIPRWKLSVEAPVAPLVAKLSTMHLTLSILLVVNSIFSIAAGLAVAAKKDVANESSLQTSAFSVANPRFV